MRYTLIALAAGLFGASLWTQSGQSMLDRHATALKEAKSLVLKAMVQPIGGSAVEETISLSKPGMIRAETADGFVVSDGKTIWEYNKSGNSYTETNWSPESARKLALKSDLWAWGAFFDPGVLKDAEGVTVGSKRKVKGIDVVELNLTTKSEPKVSGTLYINPSSGMAVGAYVKSAKPGGADLLITTTSIQVDPTIPESAFTFTAPSGATKVDPNAAPKEVKFAKVQAILMAKCMPCHSAQNMKGGANLTNYNGVMASGITAGDADGSSLVKYIDGRSQPRMPKDRPPLSQVEIDTIKNWISGGAKED